jgi:hypothetical protein
MKIKHIISIWLFVKGNAATKSGVYKESEASFQEKNKTGVAILQHMITPHNDTRW